MTYNKLFPVSESFITNLIPETFETNIYSDNSLKCAIVELGVCKANFHNKEVFVIGWNKNSWIIKCNNKLQYLPYEHFIELKTIKAAPFN